MTPSLHWKQRVTEEPLDESEREWKTGLKLDIQKTKDHGMWSYHFMANRWGNNENSNRLYFLGFQNRYGWWPQPRNSKTFAPWKINHDQPTQHIKDRDVNLLTNVCVVKGMVFPVVMYGCESWTMKKTAHSKVGAFKLWCCRRLLRVRWTAWRSNQSMLKNIIPKYSLEYSLETSLMLKLKL